jgi:hypothetical protein
MTILLLAPGTLNTAYTAAYPEAMVIIVLHPALMTRYPYNPLAIDHRRKVAASFPGNPRIIDTGEYHEFITDLISSRPRVIAPHIPDDDVLADYERIGATIIPNLSFYLPLTASPTMRGILSMSMKKAGFTFTSTDMMNRKSLPKGLQTPNLPVSFPVTQADALSSLHNFVTGTMKHFGDYEDAISSTDVLLYHSNISSSLNIGLLTAADIISSIRLAIRRGVPHNSVEAFFRQIFGWREYMHAIWWNSPRDTSGTIIGTWREFMASSLKRHYIDKREPLDNISSAHDLIDSPSTPPIVKSTVESALSSGYAHHIIRLMVIGNYLYLIAADPVVCVNIFMSMTVDAYPWVMYGNVVYMSRFTFGRVYTRRPYYSSSKYIARMLSGGLDEESTIIFDALYHTLTPSRQ